MKKLFYLNLFVFFGTMLLHSQNQNETILKQNVETKKEESPKKNGLI